MPEYPAIYEEAEDGSDLIFFGMDVCRRCGHDYYIHAPYGQCPDWTRERANDQIPPYFTRKDWST